MRRRLVILALGLGLWAATAAQAAQLGLQWDPYTPPDGVAVQFQIQRCVQAGSAPCGPTDLAGATAPQTAASYTDRTALANVTYCYAVVATTTTPGWERSDPSNVACALAVGKLPVPLHVVIR